MAEPAAWLPLFPLNTVLFPGGILFLRVFETRYIDMVRDCMKRAVPFGVALIKSGREVGAAAEPEAVGCLAHIIDWDMEAGILLLRTQGGDRFRILDTQELPDHRVEARIALLAVKAAVPVTDIHIDCAKALRNVTDNILAQGRAQQGNAFESPFAMPLQLDNADWVANRWCELLPIPLKARQKLLELDDAQSRLALVYQFLRQHELL